MYRALSPGAIGVRTANNAEAISAARAHGFLGTEFNPFELADLIDSQGVEAAKALFGDVRPAGIGLSVEWRQGDDVWRDGLEKLPRAAKAAAAVGCTRCSTWVLSGSNDRAMEENIALHIARFTPISEILGEHGLSLGLEFIGPKTLRDSFKHPFIYEAKPMLDLAKEIGPNVGLLLDCWHWYTSGGTVADIEAMTAKDIVYVHVNDAPAGVPVDQQVDNVRCLPGETGVIDIAAFLGALKKIGYDGPVVAEPFKRELNDLPSDDARLAAVAASLEKIGV